MNANRIFLLIFAAFVLPVSAQQNLETAYRTTGSAVVAAFESQRQVLQTSSAIIKDGRREIACGVVVSPDGYILTKASEVTGITGLAVTVDKQNFSEVKLVVMDPAWDVALLKVEATNLVPVVFAPTSVLPQGTWVVANGATTRTARRLLAGIISAKSREIPAAGGAVLGVTFDPKAKILLLIDVNEKSGAKEAGLLKGDVIVSIDDKKVKNIKEVSEILKDRKAGSTVKIGYRRGDQKKAVQARLSVRSELFDEEVSRNDQMSGDYSHRRSGFPRVMQHDILGARTVVGGPLLDLDGRCVGMNIARANRAESFAIPVEELKELAGRLIKTAS